MGAIMFVIALALALGLLTLIGGMLWVAIRQWRDLISVDRWTEVFMTIGRNKLRTALTTISVAWGIFVMVVLLGLGHGLDNGLRYNFRHEATNGIWISASKTSLAYGGYDVGRRLMFDN